MRWQRDRWSKRRLDAREYWREWRRWFAWRPVRVGSEMVWLETVERRARDVCPATLFDLSPFEFVPVDMEYRGIKS